MDSKHRLHEDADQALETIAKTIIHSEVCNMVPERVVIPGIVKNGVVVPQNDTPLPDGAHVEIVLSPAEVPPELQFELDQWDKASDEAWAMIDAWEAEEQ
jgi:hypothetical protein